MKPIHLVPTSLLKSVSEAVVASPMVSNDRFVSALNLSGIQSRILTFDSGIDVLDAAKRIEATNVFVPVEYDVLARSLVEEGFPVTLVIWDYHEPYEFSSQYERALLVVDELGSVGIGVGQPRLHTRAAVNGVTRFQSIKRAIDEGVWERSIRHFLFGGFNPAEPVIYRVMLTRFLNSTIEGYVSGIMFRSIMYGQAFSSGYGLYDRAVDDANEYRVTCDVTVADYCLTADQYRLWSKNLDFFVNFTNGVGGEDLVGYARQEVSHEVHAL